MSKRQIVNIVNFIRACEPRSYVDLIEPVREQIRIMKEQNLRGTFLLQYDALISPEFTDMLTCLDPTQFEIGVWFEVVQPQVEAIGLKWTGRFPWDWHTHCGFSVGYTKVEREKLVDELYSRFKSIFGYYPKVFGSWLFDSHTARYVCDKYGADAFCNCKEQYGTDGYTLWGGYYGQGYFPGRKNVFLPAQSAENRLPTPLFRMLGSDPVYQYDFGLDPSANENMAQSVITIEPASEQRGGACKEWIDWYMSENFNGECLSFGYAQAGQENSFSWPTMKFGIEYQFPLFARLQAEGKLSVEPLGDTGRWFKANYASTPASAISAHGTWDEADKQSLWYCSENYRINLYRAGENVRIRDLHVFNENQPDPFENGVCTENYAEYFALPIADGNIHSGNGVLAGLYFLDAETCKEIPTQPYRFSETATDAAEIDFGSLLFTLTKDGIKITADRPFKMEYRLGKTDRHIPTVKAFDENRICLNYKDTDYGLELACGRFESKLTAISDNNCIEIKIINA